MEHKIGVVGIATAWAAEMALIGWVEHKSNRPGNCGNGDLAVFVLGEEKIEERTEQGISEGVRLTKTATRKVSALVESGKEYGAWQRDGK